MSSEWLTFLLIGIVLIVFGVLTWKNQSTRFLHSYHYKNVRQEDIPAYTKMMGIAQIIFGAGFCLTGVLKLFVQGALSWVFLIVGLAAGIPFVFKAQRANGGSWF